MEILGISLTDPSVWASFATLTFLEIVLGIDNLIFLSILADALPAHQRQRARQLGLALALIFRLLLLFSVAWIASLTTPVLTLFDFGLSWRDIILIGGGLFLIAKATIEIHHSVEGLEDHGPRRASAGFAMVIAQIGLLDIVFSLDSVITAVGLVPLDQYPIMAAAIIIAILLMLFAAKPVGDFVARHPTVKMLALAFLVLIGVALVADGLHFHIPKGYIYFAIAFSISVEALNLMTRRGRRKTGPGPS